MLYHFDRVGKNQVFKRIGLIALCCLVGCVSPPPETPKANAPGAAKQTTDVTLDKDSTAKIEVVGTGNEEGVPYSDYRLIATGTGDKYAAFLIPDYAAMPVSPGKEVEVSLLAKVRQGTVAYAELGIYEADAQAKFLGALTNPIELSSQGALKAGAHSFKQKLQNPATAATNGKLFIRLSGPGEAVVRIHFGGTTVCGPSPSSGGKC